MIAFILPALLLAAPQDEALEVKLDRVVRDYATVRVEGQSSPARDFLLENFDVALPLMERYFMERAQKITKHRMDDLLRVIELVHYKGEDGSIAIPFLLRAYEELAGPALDPFSAGERRRAPYVIAFTSPVRTHIDEILVALGPRGQHLLFERTSDLDVESAERARAKRAILRLDPREAHGSTDLLRHLDDVDGSLVDWMGTALTKGGRKCIPRLIRRMRSTDTHRRIRAIRVAGAFYGYPNELMGELVRCAHDEDPRVRWWATWALGTFTPRSSLALIEKLGDEDAGVRARAAEALEKSISSFPGATDNGRSDYHWLMREWARKDRLRVGLREGRRSGSRWILLEAGLPALTVALEDPSEEVATFAAMTVWKLGAQADELAPVLERIVQKGPPPVRVFARHALDRMDELHESRLRRLASVSEDWDDELARARREVEALLEDVHSGDLMSSTTARLRIEMLNDALDRRIDSRLGIRRNCAPRRRRNCSPSRSRVHEELWRLGPVANARIERAFLTPRDGDYGWDDTSDLGRLVSRAGRRMLPTLAEGLESSPRKREVCAAMLRELGHEVDDATHLIVSAWRWRADEARDPAVDRVWGERMTRRYWASERRFFLFDNASRTTQRAGRAGIAVLVAALDDPSEMVRLRSIKSLASIQHRRGEIMSHLVSMLDDPDDIVRGMAAAVVREWGPAGASDRASQVLAELGLS